jgi:hypothetical protein
VNVCAEPRPFRVPHDRRLARDLLTAEAIQ